MAYPVHSYGSDQVLQAWRETQRNKQLQDQAITQAILQGVSTGAVEAKPGTGVYKGLEKRFGPEFTKGVAERGMAVRQQQQLEYAVNNFNLAMKYFDTATQLQGKLGDQANPMIKKWTPKINELIKNAGLGDVDVNLMYDAQLNKQKIQTAALSKIKELTDLAVNTPTRANLQQARTAYNVVLGHKSLMDGTTKDALQLGQKSLDDVEKQIIEREKQVNREQMERVKQGNRLALVKARAEQPGKPSLTNLKLKTWEKHFSAPETLTPQEKRLIGVDIDPYISKASNFVQSDLSYFSKTAAQKAQAVIELADLMKRAQAGEPVIEAAQVEEPEKAGAVSRFMDFLGMGKGEQAPQEQEYEQIIVNRATGERRGLKDGRWITITPPNK